MDWKTRAKELIFRQIDEMECSDRKKKFLKLVDYSDQIEVMIELAKEVHSLTCVKQKMNCARFAETTAIPQCGVIVDDLSILNAENAKFEYEDYD